LSCTYANVDYQLVAGFRDIEPKVYLTDLGFVTLYGMEDKGRRIENLVAIELFRKKHYTNPLLEIYFWKDYSGLEVDFAIKEGLKIKQLIQVCYDIDDITTRERELKALVKASKQMECDNLLVITWDYEDKEQFRGKKIEFIPLWRWLLTPDVV
ncbi:MAG: DUF4143 domain-containing protein, partial [Candidatus Methanoperedens sp.]|nr:DUF4143 domain-containing protein [Candidatus Methanoperedens sp.]